MRHCCLWLFEIHYGRNSFIFGRARSILYGSRIGTQLRRLLCGSRRGTQEASYAALEDEHKKPPMRLSQRNTSLLFGSRRGTQASYSDLAEEHKKPPMRLSHSNPIKKPPMRLSQRNSQTRLKKPGAWLQCLLSAG